MGQLGQHGRAFLLINRLPAHEDHRLRPDLSVPPAFSASHSSLDDDPGVRRSGNGKQGLEAPTRKQLRRRRGAPSPATPPWTLRGAIAERARPVCSCSLGPVASEWSTPCRLMPLRPCASRQRGAAPNPPAPATTPERGRRPGGAWPSCPRSTDAFPRRAQARCHCWRARRFESFGQVHGEVVAGPPDGSVTNPRPAASSPQRTGCAPLLVQCRRTLYV